MIDLIMLIELERSERAKMKKNKSKKRLGTTKKQKANRSLIIVKDKGKSKRGKKMNNSMFVGQTKSQALSSRSTKPKKKKSTMMILKPLIEENEVVFSTNSKSSAKSITKNDPSEEKICIKGLESYESTKRMEPVEGQNAPLEESESKEKIGEIAVKKKQIIQSEIIQSEKNQSEVAPNEIMQSEEFPQPNLEDKEKLEEAAPIESSLAEKSEMSIEKAEIEVVGPEEIGEQRESSSPKRDENEACKEHRSSEFFSVDIIDQNKLKLSNPIKINIQKNLNKDSFQLEKISETNSGDAARRGREKEAQASDRNQNVKPRAKKLKKSFKKATKKAKEPKKVVKKESVMPENLSFKCDSVVDTKSVEFDTIAQKPHDKSMHKRAKRQGKGERPKESTREKKKGKHAKKKRNTVDRVNMSLNIAIGATLEDESFGQAELGQARKLRLRQLKQKATSENEGIRNPKSKKSKKDKKSMKVNKSIHLYRIQERLGTKTKSKKKSRMNTSMDKSLGSKSPKSKSVKGRNKRDKSSSILGSSSKKGNQRGSKEASKSIKFKFNRKGIKGKKQSQYYKEYERKKSKKKLERMKKSIKRKTRKKKPKTQAKETPKILPKEAAKILPQEISEPFDLKPINVNSENVQIPEKTRNKIVKTNILRVLDQIKLDIPLKTSLKTPKSLKMDKKVTIRPKASQSKKHPEYLQRHKLRYYLGRGNNDDLIRRLMLKRGWWESVSAAKAGRPARLTSRQEHGKRQLRLDPDDRQLFLPRQSVHFDIQSTGDQPLPEPFRDFEQGEPVQQPQATLHQQKPELIQFCPVDLHIFSEPQEFRARNRPFFQIL